MPAQIHYTVDDPFREQEGVDAVVAAVESAGARQRQYENRLTVASMGHIGAALPRTRFATGGAINNTFRQIGAALGISALIAVLGTAAPGAMDGYQRAWGLMALTGAAAGFTALALGRVRARHVGEPAPGALPLAAESEPS